jgi:beta-N-acetylhexosaminidase
VGTLMKNRQSFQLRPIHILLFLVPAVIFIGILGASKLNPGRASSSGNDAQIITPIHSADVTLTLDATPTPAVIATTESDRIPPAFTLPPLATPTLAPPPTPPITPVATNPDVETILNQLTLEQKIGQMVMIGIPGQTVDSLTYNRIAQQNIGGIILLTPNTAGPEQVRALTAELQRIALENGPRIPLFIAWNEEGGFVSRRQAGMTHFPSSMALGAVNDPDLVYAVGQAVGREMRSLGLNMNYAPVLDVNTHEANPVIGLRAFGDDPERVSRLGEQYIAGLQEMEVIAVAKHFPGHGGVDVDSHFALPRLESGLDQLWQIELPPFATAVEAGVGSIMVAHMQTPALDDSGIPASLSPNIIGQLLRQEMGYGGVIMTDDIGMAAITNRYTIAQAAVMAVQAGNDIILAVETATYPDIIITAIRQAVENGSIAEAQIDASVRRILHLKESYPMVWPADRPLLPNQAEHQTQALNAGRDAVKQKQDAAGWLPLQLPNNNLVIVSPLPLNPGTQRFDNLTLLGERLSARGLTVTELFYNPRNPASVRQAQASALSHTPDAFLVVTWDAILRQAQAGDTSQEELVTALLETDRPVIVIFGSLPYDQQRFTTAPTQITMHGDTDGQIEGVLSLLLEP